MKFRFRIIVHHAHFHTLFRKPENSKFQLMTMETIDSDGKPVSTATAIKLYKEFMLAIGYLEKDELSHHAEYFADAIKEQLECLTEDAKGDLIGIKERIKDAKERLKGALTASQKEEIIEEIKSHEDDLNFEVQDLNDRKAELAAFKLDKRIFLIDYVNQETQGS